MESVEGQAPSTEVDKQALRKSLESNFEKSDDTINNGTPTEPAQNKSFVNGDNQQQKETILAPASWTKEEKEAFTNPNSGNAHVLQRAMSRREYELRSEFGRQTQGLSLKEKEFADISSAVTPEVREEYLREGIAVPDLVRRSIAWDKRVKEGVHGGLEFLEAHGYTPQDIVNYLSNGHQPQQPEYLTRDQAEQLAQEKIDNAMQLNQQSGIAEHNAVALQSFLDSKPVFRGDPGTAAQVESAVAEEIEYLKYRGFQGSTSQLLETSYQRAIANNTALSSLNTQTARTPDIYQQMERVRSAKAASKSASGSLGSGSPAHKSNNLRESLERNFAKS